MTETSVQAEPSAADASLPQRGPVREGRTWDLDLLLNNRRWVRRTTPFPHVVAADVFRGAFYDELERDFRRLEREHPDSFTRTMGAYDASGLALGPFADGPLGIFVSRQWHDLIAGVAGVQATGEVNATLHHHDPGGKSGWPHNDLNPGWFGGPPPGPDEVRLNTDSPVHYLTGARPDGVDARETVRCVSLLFYLGNPPWQPGDGGETALYPSLRAKEPAALVPPVNNSLMLFECTPFTYHGFVSNRTKPRNSLVMWLHRDKAEVAARWGERTIVGW